MDRRVPGILLALVIALLWAVTDAGAQGPTIDDGQGGGSRERSSLGRTPGAGARQEDTSGEMDGILGGRAGTGVPRAPTSVTRPGGRGFGPPPVRGIALPEALPFAESPVYGALALPGGPEEDGPPDGLTLDMAIPRLIRENLDLRSQFFEIPQAQADILTASLRANPVFYADSQLVPYGNYSEKRPGGSTQYDVNISYPLDLSRKRQARTDSACRAKRVLEAQYQDAIRLQLDNLYTAYIEVLAARETVRFAREGVKGLDVILGKAERQSEQGELTRGELIRVKIQRDSARIGLKDAEESHLKAKRALIPLLRLTPAQAEALELRGSIRDQAPPPPPGTELVRMALEGRPDLVAYRLGLGRAESDVKVALAERYQDVYVLAQPYTFQDNAPFGTKSAHSWALGVTVPLPLYNRNQGNIQRARHNVSQSRTELSAQEIRVIGEVRQAEREYLSSRESVLEVERELLPHADQLVSETRLHWSEGEASLLDYLNARREYNDVVRQYRDTSIRHRRSMLALNTAVGRRLLP